MLEHELPAIPPTPPVPPESDVVLQPPISQTFSRHKWSFKQIVAMLFSVVVLVGSAVAVVLVQQSSDLRNQASESDEVENLSCAPFIDEAFDTGDITDPRLRRIVFSRDGIAWSNPDLVYLEDGKLILEGNVANDWSATSILSNLYLTGAYQVDADISVIRMQNAGNPSYVGSIEIGKKWWRQDGDDHFEALRIFFEGSNGRSADLLRTVNGVNVGDTENYQLPSDLNSFKLRVVVKDEKMIGYVDSGNGFTKIGELTNIDTGPSSAAQFFMWVAGGRDTSFKVGLDNLVVRGCNLHCDVPDQSFEFTDGQSVASSFSQILESGTNINMNNGALHFSVPDSSSLNVDKNARVFLMRNILRGNFSVESILKYENHDLTKRYNDLRMEMFDGTWNNGFGFLFRKELGTEKRLIAFVENLDSWVAVKDDKVFPNIEELQLRIKRTGSDVVYEYREIGQDDWTTYVTTSDSFTGPLNLNYSFGNFEGRPAGAGSIDKISIVCEAPPETVVDMPLSTESGTIIACNTSCTENRDCSATQVCFEGKCRLSSNPTNDRCESREDPGFLIQVYNDKNADGRRGEGEAGFDWDFTWDKNGDENWRTYQTYADKNGEGGRVGGLSQNDKIRVRIKSKGGWEVTTPTEQVIYVANGTTRIAYFGVRQPPAPTPTPRTSPQVATTSVSPSPSITPTASSTTTLGASPTPRASASTSPSQQTPSPSPTPTPTSGGFFASIQAFFQSIFCAITRCEQ